MGGLGDEVRVAYSPDGKSLAVSTCEKGEIALYDLRTGATLWGDNGNRTENSPFFR